MNFSKPTYIHPRYVRKGHVQTRADWRRTWRKATLNPKAAEKVLWRDRAEEPGDLSTAQEANVSVPPPPDAAAPVMAPMPKFPRTPHIFDAGGNAVTRDDLILDSAEAAEFYSGAQVVLEEKVDGANLGVYINPNDHKLLFQNRSHFVCSSSGSQWKKLDAWEHRHGPEVRRFLVPGRHVLYGEWLAQTHSLEYDQLPSYFVAFDVFDRVAARFWSRTRLRKALAAYTTIPMVPPVVVGPLTGPDDLRRHLDTPSRYRSGGAFVEGVYLRLDDGPWLRSRAKLVRPDFIQAINDGQHWTRREGRRNVVRQDLHGGLWGRGRSVRCS